MNRLPRGLEIAAGIIWLSVLVAGLAALTWFDTTPGDSGAPPRRWPEDTGLRLAAGKFTLVMLVHPRCPCSRAGFHELALIMARCQGLLEARVLAWSPPGAGPFWPGVEALEAATAIPGVQVAIDGDGREARLFGVQTSGHTLVYDPGGALQFSGGITAARGHEGDNVGASSIIALVQTGKSVASQTPVFGCSLREPAPVPNDRRRRP